MVGLEIHFYYRVRHALLNISNSQIGELYF